MGSLSFGEIITILLVILIVFGPDRLPELARKTGQVVAKIREASSIVTKQIEREMGPEMDSIRELQQQVKGVKEDLTGTVAKLAALDPPPSADHPSDPQGAGTSNDEPDDDGPITSFDLDPSEPKGEPPSP